MPSSDARSGPAATVDGLFLLDPHREELRRALRELEASDHWHGGLPVLLLERCWLRLSRVPVEHLARRLPPDCSQEAPELRRYRELLAAGRPAWEAQRICWEDFGADACREALRKFWDAQERGTQGWTLETYLDLLQQYRRRFDTGGPRPVPLLVLARRDGSAQRGRHRLLWLGPDAAAGRTSMRDTCP
ncbi:hypothetical protein VB738_03890 [Cyanobium gracile UHCC 0139]|uniref:Uncharacterized protein n=1 Tax=Cyanobium gracile UHCC 0139 TaxID=3110308 RepID=A0ABU5RRL0_9CYAN|nr:hypothetical protein [Cyanobium gracile]MEA5390398.1 hypothetical protein [Cyanobium gracile UHCC 0139]